MCCCVDSRNAAKFRSLAISGCTQLDGEGLHTPEDIAIVAAGAVITALLERQRTNALHREVPLSQEPEALINHIASIIETR